MSPQVLGDMLARAIGGGWGSEEQFEDSQKVVVIRGADFPSASLQSLDGAPKRFEATTKVRARALQPGDIILEISGGTKDRPTGRTVFVTEALLGQAIEPVIPASFCRLLRVDDSKADPKFVFYALQDLYARGGTWEFQNQSTGLSNFQFELFRNNYAPPALGLGEQRAIAEMLGALDDKIAANTRLNRQADDLLAAMFARATEGASAGVLSDVALVNVAATRPQADGFLRYIDIGSVSEGSFEFPGRTPGSEAPGRARLRVQTGDTLWSTVRPNRRSHALVLDADTELVASTGLAVITPQAGAFASVYEATRTPEFTSYLEGVAEGSAYPAVRAERFLDAPVPVLSPPAKDEFEAYAQPVRWRAHAAGAESRLLADLRDLLLPGLMSGTLRVRDAEKSVEGVV